jgi:hypothetical protein
MQSNPSTNPPHMGDLAKMVNCLDEDGFAKLAGVTLSTLNAWRKRGLGPEYVLLGRNYLYPITAVQTYIADRVRKRTHVAPQRSIM